MMSLNRGRHLVADGVRVVLHTQRRDELQVLVGEDLACRAAHARASSGLGSVQPGRTQTSSTHVQQPSGTASPVSARQALPDL